MKLESPAAAPDGRSGNIRNADPQGPSGPRAGESIAWEDIAETHRSSFARRGPAEGVGSSVSGRHSREGRWSFKGIRSFGQSRTGLPYGYSSYSLTPAPATYGYNPLQGQEILAAYPLRSGYKFPGVNLLDRFLPQASFNVQMGENSKDTDGNSEGIVLWGQGDLHLFNGNLTKVGMNYRGNLKTAHVGMDLYDRKQVLVGFSFMRSWTNMDYSDDGIDGMLRNSLNTVHPYLYWQPWERFSTWVIGGLGRGQVDVREPGRSHDFGADFRMLSGGMRTMLAKRANTEFGIRMDAFTASLMTNLFEDIRAIRGTAGRTRMMLELVHNKPLSTGGRSLSMKMEVGARQDFGDADQGIGAEAGFRIGLLDANSGLDVVTHGRALVLHESDYRDWGAGMQVSWNPGRKDRGLQLSMMSSRGQDRGGRITLWNNPTLGAQAMGAGYIPTASRIRTDSEVAYGIDLFGGRGLLTSYSRLQITGLERDVRLGAELSLISRRPRTIPSRFALELFGRETPDGIIDPGITIGTSIPVD